MIKPNSSDFYICYILINSLDPIPPPPLLILYIYFCYVYKLYRFSVQVQVIVCKVQSRRSIQYTYNVNLIILKMMYQWRKTNGMKQEMKIIIRLICTREKQHGNLYLGAFPNVFGSIREKIYVYWPFWVAYISGLITPLFVLLLLQHIGNSAAVSECLLRIHKWKELMR